MAAVNPAIPAEVSFDNMLGRIGLDVVTRDAYRVVTGIRTGIRFVMASRQKKSAVNLMTAVNAFNPGAGNPAPQLTQVQADCIVAARHSMEFNRSRGEPFDPDAFAPAPVPPAVGPDPMETMLEWHERGQMIVALPAKPDITLPELKDSASYPAWKNTSSAIFGEARMPSTGATYLTLIRSHKAAVTPEMLAAEYPTVDDNIVVTTSFAYDAVKEANRILFKALSTATSNGSLHTLVSPFRADMDGIGAWHALERACHEPGLANLRIQTAKAVLQAITWPLGTKLEAFVLKHTEQHAICRNNLYDIPDADKASWFRQGIASNNRYCYVALAWDPNLTFQECCNRINAAVMHDRQANPNVVDRRHVNQAVAGAARGAGTRRRNGASRQNAPVVNGGKLTNSGLPLHNGKYNEKDFATIIEKKDKAQLLKFRELHPSHGGRARTAAAVAVAGPAPAPDPNDNENGNSDDDRSLLSDHTDESASVHDARNVSAMATGRRNVDFDFDFSNTGSRHVSLARRDGNHRSTWLHYGPTPEGPGTRGPEPLGPAPTGPGHSSHRSQWVDNRPAWLVEKERTEKMNESPEPAAKGRNVHAVKVTGDAKLAAAKKPDASALDLLSDSSDDEEERQAFIKCIDRRNACAVAATIGGNVAGPAPCADTDSDDGKPAAKEGPADADSDDSKPNDEEGLADTDDEKEALTADDRLRRRRQTNKMFDCSSEEEDSVPPTQQEKRSAAAAKKQSRAKRAAKAAILDVEEEAANIAKVAAQLAAADAAATIPDTVSEGAGEEVSPPAPKTRQSKRKRAAKL
jgi:hypothetical protein